MKHSTVSRFLIFEPRPSLQEYHRSLGLDLSPSTSKSGFSKRTVWITSCRTVHLGALDRLCWKILSSTLLIATSSAFGACTFVNDQERIKANPMTELPLWLLIDRSNANIFWSNTADNMPWTLATASFAAGGGVCINPHLAGWLGCHSNTATKKRPWAFETLVSTCNSDLIGFASNIAVVPGCNDLPGRSGARGSAESSSSHATACCRRRWSIQWYCWIRNSEYAASSIGTDSEQWNIAVNRRRTHWNSTLLNTRCAARNHNTCNNELSVCTKLSMQKTLSRSEYGQQSAQCEQERIIVQATVEHGIPQWTLAATMESESGESGHKDSEVHDENIHYENTWTIYHSANQ